ncbi:MAG TPA: energy transducer TonB [Bacteroidales bacterium]|jgi:protein TonB|nr:energy transducer TonB [Bacteroidales bacterium]MDX9907617.1 energy transducer TonB [Bacteroidales bacterium]HOX78288.1 energy transducer TonB [Bacteroidales bacterium]HPM92237.1 energy transducer TonB [Bacteroidales bacterium]
MDQKKTTKADLENKKIIFRQIGLVIALAAVLLAFEWKTYEKSVVDLGTRQVEDIAEDIIPITEQKIKPPPPAPPKQVIQINVVEDDIEVEDDIDIDVEADENTEVQEYVAPVKVEEEESAEEVQIFMVVESMPEFPGGEPALYKFLAENIKYPQMAKESGIQGRVFVTFVVERDGRVTDVRVLRGIGGGCDEEAIRVVQNMPKWTPGKQRGKAVRVQYNLPVKFTLQ